MKNVTGKTLFVTPETSWRTLIALETALRGIARKLAKNTLVALTTASKDIQIGTG